jgi:NADH dehydrogenase [ubiquinone] 1 alpha subcomplex assembly factor 6
MPLTYCGNLVRQQDPDRFLLSLLAPAHARAGLWAIYAFNYEIARTREVVSETVTGLIRLQWWRDSIDQIYNNETPRHHPVVEALADVIRRYDLPKDLFLNLIYAREFDLEDVAPADMTGLLIYADATVTPLNLLAQRITGDSDTDEVVKEVSMQYALIGLIRAVPHHVSARRCMLPEAVLMRFSLSPQKLFDFNQKEKLPEVIKEVMKEFTEIRNVQSGLLRAHNALVRLYANQIMALHYDVYDPRMAIPPKFKALRLWFSAR